VPPAPTTSTERRRLRRKPIAVSAPAIAQCGHEIRLCHVDGRRQPEENSGEQRDRRGEPERPPVQPDLPPHAAGWRGSSWPAYAFRPRRWRDPRPHPGQPAVRIQSATGGSGVRVPRPANCARPSRGAAPRNANSRRLARFTHAMSRTNPTAAVRVNSAGRMRPTAAS